jgi:hypothetical protein
LRLSRTRWYQLNALIRYDNYVLLLQPFNVKRASEVSMDRTNDLLAIEAIKILKARYCRFVDYKDWTQFEQLFLPDAAFEAPDDGLAPFSGAHTFVEHARASLQNCVTVHHCHTPEIELLDAENAIGTWAMQDTLTWKEDAVTSHGYRQITGSGYYHETFRKANGSWRIAVWKLTRLRLDFVKQDSGTRKEAVAGQRQIWS